MGNNFTGTVAVAAAGGMTLTTARGWIRQFARNAGSSAMYSDEMIDRALQTVGEDFCRATKCLVAVDTVTLDDGDEQADVSGLTTFTPERLISAYVDGEADPLELCDWAELNRRRVDAARDGVPTALAFEDLATAQVHPTPDDAYTLKLRWWEPFTTWVPGVASGTADALSLNIREEHLKLILPWGPPSVLQYREPEMLLASKGWQEYLTQRTRLRGAGALGSKAFEKNKADW